MTSVLPLSLPPRGLSRGQAAEYLGIGASTFDALVRDGRMPPAKRIGARTVWDRVALDDAFARLGGAAGMPAEPEPDATAEDDPNPWDDAL